MSTFQERKDERKAHYEKWIKGWKLIPCGACNGSGRYDTYSRRHGGSPPCGACKGTGKERVSPAKYVVHFGAWRSVKDA